MPTLRSREVIPKPPLQKPSLDKTPLDPSTPSKADVLSSSTASPSSVAAPSRRRSLRLAAISAPAIPSVENGRKSKRKARACSSAAEPENGVSESMSLRSGTRIARRRLGDGDRRVSSCDEKGQEKAELGLSGDCSEGMGGNVSTEGEMELEEGKSSDVGSVVTEEIRDEMVLEENFALIGNDDVKLEGDLRENARGKSVMEFRKEAGRSRAIELAPKFAFFKAEEEGSEEEKEEDEESEDLALNADQIGDWPGPFSTAMRIIEEREQKLRDRELKFSSSKEDRDGDVGEVKIQWMPSDNRKCSPLGKAVPSLYNLCMKVLCENAEEIESLEGVPDVLKERLMSVLCGSRNMSLKILGLLVSGLPTEIILSDCSWATEGQFEGVFRGCNTEKLKVLQLDLCGRCMPDYVLQATLSRSPNSLPSLTSISLKGAYRLSDDGLNAIATSAPMLSSVNFNECSLITSTGIIAVADKLQSVLRELYIDDCQNVDAMLILPALLKLKFLEVLSVAGIETVGNKFVKKLIPVCGSNMKELVFARCRKLTAASLKVIGENCSQLCAIDLQHLNRLNDSAMIHLANGCRSIQKLKLRCNAFSDEAIAAFVEASGGSLTELSLNNVAKVAQQTSLSIARRCSSTLRSLDISFCRKMTNEALGLIVDNCSQLRILKLFGCTQVTDVFLEGHSNSLVTIVGSKGPIFEEINMLGFL